MANTCPWGVGSKTSTLIAFETAYGVTPADAATKAVRMPFNSNGVGSSQALKIAPLRLPSAAIAHLWSVSWATMMYPVTSLCR